MRYLIYSILLLLCFHCSGQKESIINLTASIGITGDPMDVTVPTVAGLVLVGGSTDVDAAIAWMIERSTGGDFVIIRSGGSTGYNDYIYSLGKVNSVETLLIDSREKALRPEVGQRIREAEAVFIAGGDQANYVNYWSDSEVSKALVYLIKEKQIPLGGTSAGCAVLSDYIFDARNGSVTSPEALSNPYRSEVSVSKSFIDAPFLTNTITDQHYSQRERHGRHVTFIARLSTDAGVLVKGIGVDERTAVCIDADGNATVFGSNNAYFIIPESKPEICLPNTPLHWKQNEKALRVYSFTGSNEGTPAFNLKSWPTTNPTAYWFVENGVLKSKGN